MGKTPFRIGIVVAVVAVAGIGISLLPPVRERLVYRFEEVRSKIHYMISPPEKAIFVPQQSVDQIVQATFMAMTLAAPLPPTTTPTLGSTQVEATATPGPTATPTPEPTAIPARVELTGIVHEYQKWNNCGPTTLAMALTYWGWKGDQFDTAPVLKPNARDKNVMPYEMQAYVQEHTEFNAVIRQGGDLDTLKRFIAAGFPVVIEKGYEDSGDGWMGHYEVIHGYDDARSRFIAQDSYAQAEGSPYLAVPYEKLKTYWMHFNNLYLVIYPPDREAEVTALLGPEADETANYQHAAALASTEIDQNTERQLFFAWYNRGTNLVALSDYAGAAAAFDEAYKIYPSIPEKKRPWRMIWYQTGPYFAYFYTGRYLDVIDLATKTLDQMTEPNVEETFVWRARARIATGDTEGAIEDLRNALNMHPGFTPATDALSSLGVTP